MNHSRYCCFADKGDGLYVCRCGRTIKTAIANPSFAPVLCEAGTSCRHLGAQTRLVGCQSCSGNVQIKVFACAVWGECTLAKQIDGVACCATCERWEPDPS